MGIRYKKTLGLLRVLSKLKHVTIRLVTTTIVTILSKRNQLDKTNSNQFKQIQTNYISNLSEDISPCAHSGARCSVSESVWLSSGETVTRDRLCYTQWQWQSTLNIVNTVNIVNIQHSQHSQTRSASPLTLPITTFNYLN